MSSAEAYNSVKKKELQYTADIIRNLASQTKKSKLYTRQDYALIMAESYANPLL